MHPLIAVPAIFALEYRAISHKSLTPAGALVALLTAITHAIHPWSVFFVLLGVFFLAGSHVTKIKHDVKARLTLSSVGSTAGEGPRNASQVLANSLVASVLVLLHTLALRLQTNADLPEDQFCFRWGAIGRPADVLVVGIVANYAAVAADTFSSELGILANAGPRLVTRPWKTVPKGTNGGVTGLGLVAGLLGSSIVTFTATLLLQFCGGNDFVSLLPMEYLQRPLKHFGSSGASASKASIPPSVNGESKPLFTKIFDTLSNPRVSLLKYVRGVSSSLQGSTIQREMSASLWDARKVLGFFGVMLFMGLFGSILDSILGAVLQASVVDSRSGKVVEGKGGAKVPVTPRGSASGLAGPETTNLRNRSAKKEHGEELDRKVYYESRKVAVGMDVLSNNGVNFLMALLTSLTAMSLACWYWDIAPLNILGVYIEVIDAITKPFSDLWKSSVTKPFSTLWD
ncbi:hypothetical protein P152DRAFT_5779 [Eremomyces bilateralis CBS 781.70]|uniref:DUF92-domain-containing protein n=1 Tax=Eremomyces bilateralis CBS 781.70 TaxID=1392243 RepID=A0A6G1GG81_9PEZI|nr:uncharacterized protein P152DRAFT_5779 [Eremomyces bilateralis CBS 781.70]KAF1817002.1 hypothetical protein P152DRAFT_5779 [Eremomyces bilateralis CBS 781.70]